MVLWKETAFPHQSGDADKKLSFYLSSLQVILPTVILKMHAQVTPKNVGGFLDTRCRKNAQH